jgi:D-2-hydroxyacid dehydrogenase (NADP+)
MPESILLTAEVWRRHVDEIRTIAPRLGVVSYEGPDALEADALGDVTIGFLSGDVYPDRVTGLSVSLLRAPRLAWLQSFSAGVDHPFFGMIRERGCRLTTGSGTAATPIAETALMYLLALSRDLPDWLDAQRRHEWQPREIGELAGSSLAVLGMGPIGRRVAELGLAFGMTVEAVRRTPTGDEPCPTHPMSALREVLGRADWVVIALPLTDDTRGLFDAERLGWMRPGARLVNVGRGEIVDEASLVDALRAGHLAGAGLDVFAVEPLPPDSPLWDMPNVIVTPHSSGTSPQSSAREERLFLDNLARFVAGRALLNEAT